MKRIISATISDSSLEELERISKALGVSRSRALEYCIATTAQLERERLMAEGYAKQAALYEEIAEEGFAAQREVLPEW